MADFLKDNFPSMRKKLIKGITGAATTEKELQFLKDTIPLPTSSITEAEIELLKRALPKK